MASDFQFIARHTVQECPEYTFELDEHRRGDEQALLAHLVFHQFTPSALKRAKREWKLFRQCVTAPIYCVCQTDDPYKWSHFVSLFGFEPTGLPIRFNNGAERWLYISVVNERKPNFQHSVPDLAVGSSG